MLKKKIGVRADEHKANPHVSEAGPRREAFKPSSPVERATEAPAASRCWTRARRTGTTRGRTAIAGCK